MKNKYLLGLCLLLAGCASTNVTNASGTTYLNGFDDQKDLNTMMLVNKSSARMELSEDKVKDGKYSGKLTVEYAGTTSIITLYQSLRNVAKGLDYTDFTNYTTVHCWIYNATSVEKDVYVSAVTRNSYQLGQDLCQDKIIKLTPNSWNEINYVIDVSKISIVDTAKLIVGIDFRFSKAARGVVDTYYVDSISVF